MNRNVIRLTESELRDVIKESVKTILMENHEEPIFGIEMYDFDGDGFSQSTDRDFADEQYTMEEAMREAEYYLQHNPNLETVIRVYNKETNETVKLFV